MRVKKLNSNREILIRTSKYLIDWENDGDSSLEIKFRDLIKPYWIRQIVLHQFVIPGSRMRIDFLNCNKKIAVEINGDQHENYNKFFHRGSRVIWLEQIKRDIEKFEWCNLNGIKFLELKKEDLDNFSPEYIKEKFQLEIV